MAPSCGSNTACETSEKPSALWVCGVNRELAGVRHTAATHTKAGWSGNAGKARLHSMYDSIDFNAFSSARMCTRCMEMVRMTLTVLICQL